MDGVLIVDKPEGLTSHDVVAIARRCLGERRIGHTGTLDPLATGVLPLACGRATRLVRFLTATEKTYDATIRFGVTTDSYDRLGREVTRSNLVPTREAVEAALVSLRGEYLQTPPVFSAKKVGGERAYQRARRDEAVTLTAVPVRVSQADLVAFTGVSARIAITCSPGFYVRSFAHALGALLGTGACLEALRRTRSGTFTLDRAVGVAQLRESTDTVARQWIPLEQLLPDLAAVRLDDEGCRRVRHGQLVALTPELGREADLARSRDSRPQNGGTDGRQWVRLLDKGGRLLAVGQLDPSGRYLHPSVVLA